jgi:hypothetical protein
MEFDMRRPDIKNKQGAPTIYNEKVGNDICRRLSEGETLSSITKSLGIAQNNIYDWVAAHKSFAEKYESARKHQAISLVNELLDNSNQLESERALGMKVRADIIRWYAGRVNPELFGDVKRLELKGEVRHQHIHELPTEQKKRIAESWLLSQQDSPGISAETTGPDIEVGVKVIEPNSAREVPARRVSTDTGAKRKPQRQQRKVSRKGKGLIEDDSTT